MKSQAELAREASAFMLALVGWREARGEVLPVRIAVMYSVLNRVERPAWWGRSVLEVVGKLWQYSALTAPGDPNLIKWPRHDDAVWWATFHSAYDVLEYRVANPMPGADSYHDVSIPQPGWAGAARFWGGDVPELRDQTWTNGAIGVTE